MILAVGTAVLLWIFWATAESAIYLWDTSSTYTYAYLVAPISLYLVWSDRHALMRIITRSAPIGVVIVLTFSILWLFADILGINAGRHVALVGMFQGLCLCVLGGACYKRLAFALNYLWLLVPTGDFLLSPLQIIAHRGSVALIQLSSIPVFADGLLIQVPQGNFIVEPGCAGLNFLLAALALSLLYGKVLYRSLSARILCVLVALGVSIIANIVRIYLIIALTEWTDQKIGLADDHLLFGWGFFSIIMLALMWGGARLAQPHFADTAQQQPVAEVVARGDHPAVMVGVALLAAALGSSVGAWLSTAAVSSTRYTSLPQQLGPWQQEDRVPFAWAPRVLPGEATLEAAYIDARGVQVQVAITIYDPQRDGHEAASAINSPADGRVWHLLESKRQDATLANRSVSIAAATLQAGSGRRNALFWYQSGDCITDSRLRSKLCRAWQHLAGRSTAGAFVALSMQQGTDRSSDDAALLDLAQRLPAFTRTGLRSVSVNKE